MSTVTDGPGPITRVLIRTVWCRLFDDDPANPIYLPRVIRDGYPKWDLPPYDPARPGGTSAPVPIPGVPSDVADSACARNDVKFVPIADSEPKLQLQNIVFTNLSVMQQVSLAFSDTEPIFTAVVGVGSSEKPFTLAANEPQLPNYLFLIGCCEPRDGDSRTCSDRHWDADAAGQFTAKATSSRVSLTIRLNTQIGKPLSISVEGIGVNADPAGVSVDFDVQGQRPWVQQLAQMAIQQGIINGALVNGLQTFLNGPDVIANIEKLVNEALKGLVGDPRV